MNAFRGYTPTRTDYKVIGTTRTDTELMGEPHPSYTAMVAAWDKERRDQARLDKLARDIDRYAPRVGRGTRRSTHDHPTA